MKTLSASRAKDRREMARQIIALAGEHNMAACLRREEFQPHTLTVEIECPHGLAVNIDLNKAWQRCAHLHWHFIKANEVKLERAFWYNVNPCHFRKATQFVSNFDNLLETLRRDFTAINDGTAFQS